MTDELFRENARLRECDATVLALTDAGVILDRTVFYPQGGGQAGDAGWLQLAAGRRLAIVDTRKSKPGNEHAGAVLHLLAPGADANAGALLQPGTVLTAQIDWQRRTGICGFTPAPTCCAHWCRTRSTAARSPPTTRGWIST